MPLGPLLFPWEFSVDRVQCSGSCFAVDFLQSASPAPGALNDTLGVGLRNALPGVTSLRHVSLRETGWSRSPTSSVRLRPEPKGKATHGEVRNSAFPRFHEVCVMFFERQRHRGSRGLF